jgi:hypothetical protein
LPVRRKKCRGIRSAGSNDRNQDKNSEINNQDGKDKNGCHGVKWEVMALNKMPMKKEMAAIPNVVNRVFKSAKGLYLCELYKLQNV